MKGVVFVLVLAVATVAMAETLGINPEWIKGLISENNFKCFVDSGYTFALIRAYSHTGSIDQYCYENVRNARAANMSRVDLYMAPCPDHCGGASPATSQVEQLYWYVNQHGIIFNSVWLEVKAGVGVWSKSDINANRNYFNGWIKAALNKGWTIGIMTSISDWEPVFGQGFTAGGNLPLWYTFLDGKQNFDDFKPFGGWTAPTIKKFKALDKQCYTPTGFDWTPEAY